MVNSISSTEAKGYVQIFLLKKHAIPSPTPEVTDSQHQGKDRGRKVDGSATECP